MDTLEHGSEIKIPGLHSCAKPAAMRSISTFLCAFICVLSGFAQFGPGMQVTSSFMSRYDVKASDLNGDDHLDLVFQNAGAIVWCRNMDGQGSFGPLDTLYLSFPQFPSQSAHHHGFDLRDVELDGDIDVIIVDREDSVVVWLPNDGFGSFGPAQIIADLHGESFLGSMICVDVMDSPFPDVVMNVEHFGRRKVYINDGGTFPTVDSLIATWTGPMTPALVAGDLDMNGTTDLVIQHWSGTVRALLNSAGPGNSWTDTLLTSTASGASFFSGQLQLIDVDRDGDLDAADAANDNTPIWAEGFAIDSGGFHAFVASAIGPPVPYDHTGWVGYLGCGNTASALWCSGPNQDTLNWSLYDAQLGAFTTPLSWASEPGIAVVRTADLNGDGAEDLILAHSDSILTWYLNLLPASNTGAVSLSVFDTLCVFGDPYTLEHASPTGGTWSGEGVSENAFTPPGQGSFTLTYQVPDPDTGCPLVAAQTITAITEPLITLVSGIPDECAYDPLQYAAIPSGGTWSGITAMDGSVDRSCAARPNSGEVTYSMNAANGGNCTVAGDLLNLPGCLPLDLGSDITLCTPGDTLVFGVQGPANGAADLFGCDSTIFTPPSSVQGFFYPDHDPGSYQIIASIFGMNECPGYDTLVILVAPTVTLNLPFDTLSVNAQPQLLVGGDPAGGNYSINGEPVTDFNPSLYGAGPIVVDYTYEDSLTGCINSAQFIVFVEVVTGIRPDDQPSDLRLSPNPTSQQCSVWFTLNGDTRIMLTDAVGRIVGTWNATTSPFTLQLGALAKGRYLVRVEHADCVQRATLMVD